VDFGTCGLLFVVEARHRVAQHFGIRVKVSGSGRDVLVPEKGLNYPKIRALFQKAGSVGVAQNVGGKT
jgi:hypothetical protein